MSGGFSANFIPSGIDPLLQGFTQQAAQILDPERLVNPLSNLGFTAVSSLLVIGVGWYLTDRVIEPRLQATPIDGDPDEMPRMEELTDRDRRGFGAGMAALAAGLLLLALASLPAGSPLRGPDGSLTSFAAPLMGMIVPLIFLLFLVPGVVHGYVAGTVKSHRDIVAGMTSAMSTMAYYLVMAFFAAQFIAAFNNSNVGLLIALKGANFLRDLNMPAQVTVVGIVLLTAFVNLFVGSASAKWALLSGIFVPMLMGLGIAPELTQAAYRVRRQRHQHRHPADAVLPPGGRLQPALREEDRHRHHSVPDAALLGRAADYLDGVPGRLLDARPPPRPPGQLHLSLIAQRDRGADSRAGLATKTGPAGPASCRLSQQPAPDLYLIVRRDRGGGQQGRSRCENRAGRAGILPLVAATRSGPLRFSPRDRPCCPHP